MPYATATHLIDRIGEPLMIALTDRGEAQTGQIDGAVVDRALADATALVDGYLATKYALPLSEVPGLVVDITGAIAVWKLYITEAPDKVRADYDGALRMLRDIASGAVRLVGVAGVAPAASGAQGVQTNDRERPFTPDTMRGFI